MLTQTQTNLFAQALQTYTRPDQIAAIKIYQRRTELYMMTDPFHSMLLQHRSEACSEALSDMVAVGIDDVLA